MFEHIKVPLTIAMLAIATTGLTACNTVHGAGEDVEEAGEAIQHGDQHYDHRK